MSRSRDSIHRSSLPGFAKVALGAAVIAAAVGLVWWLGNGGPHASGPAYPEAGSAANSAPAEALREESLELEARFDELAAADGLASEEQLELLRHALEAQRDHLRLAGGENWEARERLRELEIKLATAQARSWLVRAEQLQADAATMQARGERAGALAALEEALRLQQAIHSSVADASVRRPARMAAISLQIELLQAEPLAGQIEQLEATARLAQAAGDVSGAEAALREAVLLQERINREFSRTRFAGRARLDELVAARASLGAIELMRERDLAAEQALALDQEGRHAEAAGLFARAQELQARINAGFPRSEAASADRVAELEVARQTAASRTRAMEGATALAGFEAALAAGRDSEARELLLRTVAQDSALQAEFPRSRLIDPARSEKLALLQLLAPHFETVQRALEGRLLPVPGAGARMFATEVPQALYAAVMGANPSRMAGQTLPVESLTSAEAEEFCRRLGLVLARPVRLPRRAEFEAALAVSGGDAWTAASSAGEPRAVEAGAANSAGFRDLRGNVAEWVASGEGEFFVAGGSYAEPPVAAPAEAFRPSLRTERYRTVGFRFMVD